MNKFEFISHVLENQKMNLVQKERFFKLASKEIGLIKPSNEVLWEEIEKIKLKLGNEDVSALLAGSDPVDNIDELNENQSRQVKDSNSIEFPKIHSAHILVQLMNKFSDNSKALKYTTHSWEHGRFENYSDFIIKIKKEWKEINGELKVLNSRLHAKISNFLFNKNLGHESKDERYYQVWGEKKLKFGWASKALETYMLNADVDPFSCPIPKEIKNLDGKYDLLFFDDYVSEFKNEIEIREDNSALVNLINVLWTDELTYDFNVEQQNTEGVSFFTDVPYLKSVLILIFKSFKKRIQFSNIVCRIDENFDENHVELCLTQLNSKCNRSIYDPKIISPTGGDLSTLIENLKNLADFSVVGEFKGGGIFKVNYLCSNIGVKNVEKLDKNYPCEGFTYVLKFYL